MDINNETPLSDAQMRSLVARAKEARETRYKELSRQRLDKIVSTKMKTAFIGALAAFEESFGFLWGKDKNESELTQSEKEMSELWEQTRTKVLNNGNTQLRAAQTEISNHIISWNRYHLDLPVKK
jgi:hypothetical protein